MICVTLFPCPPRSPGFARGRTRAWHTSDRLLNVAKPRICRRELVIGRLSPVPQGWLHWSHCYGPGFPTYQPLAGIFTASWSNEAIVEGLGAGRAGHPPSPHLHAIFSPRPSPLSAPPTRGRGWPHASPSKGRLIPQGQGSRLPLCIQAPAPPQPWTGFSPPCCSLCCSSCRATEFGGHLRSPEVSGELSAGTRGVHPLSPCHQLASGLGRRRRKKKYPTSVREAKELSQMFSQGSEAWRCVHICLLLCFREVVGGLHSKGGIRSAPAPGAAPAWARCSWQEVAGQKGSSPPPSAAHSSAEDWFCWELQEELARHPELWLTSQSRNLWPGCWGWAFPRF